MAFGTPFTKGLTINVTAAGSGGEDNQEGGGGSSLLWVGIIAVIAIVLIGAYVAFSKGMLTKKGTK